MTNDSRPVRVTISRREFALFACPSMCRINSGVGVKEEEKKYGDGASPFCRLCKFTGRTKVENIFQIHPRGTLSLSRGIEEGSLALLFLVNQSLVIIYKRACRQVYVKCTRVIYGSGGCIYYEALILNVKKKSRRRQRIARGNSAF